MDTISQIHKCLRVAVLRTCMQRSPTSIQLRPENVPSISRLSGSGFPVIDLTWFDDGWGGDNGDLRVCNIQFHNRIRISRRASVKLVLERQRQRLRLCRWIWKIEFRVEAPFFYVLNRSFAQNFWLTRCGCTRDGTGR